ncbi:hypothetical protein [Dehalogenimonas etheniformans]|uniref:Uncharacterized protein n=1 Tax=Dehalogenimonas etheniformans TaxID=1536648 RepID=A0A2P5P9Q2_9CHLR|nr:hypothetical protein [Dehalogenimonas etheniformans]PPD59038.1 hypothetical protein JP09_004060 [Dehalogenimonas etheniformans]QNT76194.1 hypothetical protein HX448_05555 [Dehalogenimonas etheniformans]
MNMDENGNLTARQRVEERLLRNKNTAFTWAAVLFWGAVSLVLDTIPSVNDSALDGGDIFALGAGAILLISSLAIFFGTGSRKGVMFRLILGFIFLCLGLGEFTDLNENIVVAGILAGIAMAIMLNVLKLRA